MGAAHPRFPAGAFPAAFARGALFPEPMDQPQFRAAPSMPGWTRSHADVGAAACQRIPEWDITPSLPSFRRRAAVLRAADGLLSVRYARPDRHDSPLDAIGDDGLAEAAQRRQ